MNSKKNKIGILGGSFDPAHKGHLAISKETAKRFKLKKIIWAITKKNPFKPKSLFSLKERITIAKKSKKTLNIKLHAAKDSFISLGDAATVTLPSRESIIYVFMHF